MIHFKCFNVSAGISESFGKYFVGTSSERKGSEIFLVTSPIVMDLLLPLPPPLPFPLPFSSFGVDVIEKAVEFENYYYCTQFVRRVLLM